MPKFHVISGSLIVAAPPNSEKKQLTISFGGEVEMSEKDRLAVDPKGTMLVTPEAFNDLKKSAEAHAAFAAKQKLLGAAPLELSPKLLAAFDALAEKQKSKPTTNAPKGK